jgi:methyltransferase (TIGR00027 family)
MAGTLIENVSDTAFWVAYYRGMEGERRDALFHDPLALVLAGERGKQIARSLPGAMMTGWGITIRTCIIDDYIRKAIGEGIDTVLNLGAGLDTRPYRLELPASLQWIEADFAPTIEYKEEKLKKETPRCRLERVKIDLANGSERRKFFADASARAKKMLVLTEGVVPYLTQEDVAGLADELRAVGNVRYWIVDYFSPEAIRMRRRSRMGRKMRNAPFRFTPADWFAFFKAHGWQSKEARYLSDEGDKIGRPMRLPAVFKVIVAVRRVFMSPEKRARYRRFAGYILLEPND